MSGGAYAGDTNNVLIIQDNLAHTGVTGNVAQTNQTMAFGSNIGAAGDGATQSSDNNTLLITQIGGNNDAGLTNPGIDQIGNAGYLSISQGVSVWSIYNLNNTVGSVQQNGGGVSGGGTYATDVNRTQITQVYNDTVGSIDQSYSGPGAPNTITINQNGANNINSVHQDGYGQTANINMATTPDIHSSLHNGGSALTTFSGYDFAAGVANPTPYLSSGVDASFADIGQGTVWQTANTNTLNANINGTGNLFGFRQDYGSGNVIGASVTGLQNAVVVRQTGSGNLATAVLGDALNDLGIAQLGTGNIAAGYLSGTANHGGVLQVGLGAGVNTGTVQTDTGASDNWIAVVQGSYSGSNNGTVHVSSGHGNVSVLVQANLSGAANNATIIISGNDINTGSFSSGGYANAVASTPGATIGNLASYFGLGVALNAVLSTSTASQVGGMDVLTPGLSIQGGSGNTLGINVVNSSDNLFATAQIGNNNSLSATIGGAGSNELAVAQVNLTSGAGNTAITSQVGLSNSIGLVQVGSNSANISQ
jgi:hypothetical protein